MLTVSEIKEVLRREHLSISKRRGQNFLVDARVERRIIEALDLKPTDYILEIGSGLGALTEDLAKGSGQVFAVEKDRALARILKEQLLGYKNLKILHQDILKTDIEILTHKKIKVVGNLPYYISTPIIGYLLQKQRERIKEIFITIQHEVGQRLLAKKNSKDYSAITIFVQYFTKPELLFSIPKRAFYPQPKVDSVFVQLTVLDQPQVNVKNEEQFFKIVRQTFSQRRKTILNSLTQRLEKKEKIQGILQEAGIDFQARPEMLSLDEFAKIEDIFYKRGIRL